MDPQRGQSFINSAASLIRNRLKVFCETGWGTRLRIKPVYNSWVLLAIFLSLCRVTGESESLESQAGLDTCCFFTKGHKIP